MRYEYCKWLVTGVEDGWIKVSRSVWNEYEIAKKLIEEHDKIKGKMRKIK